MPPQKLHALGCPFGIRKSSAVLPENEADAKNLDSALAVWAATISQSNLAAVRTHRVEAKSLNYHLQLFSRMTIQGPDWDTHCAHIAFCPLW